MQIWLSLLFILAVIGCNNGWDQDPFANESEAVKKGTLEGIQAKPLPPLTDVVFIDVDSYYDFTVGKEQIITFQYRITHPEVRYRGIELIDFANLLPGAEFDEQSLQLKWTPTAEALAGNDLITRIPLTIKVLVRAQGKTEEYRRTISINVLRSVESPIITEVNDVPDQWQEGVKYNWSIVVKDPESTATGGIQPMILPAPIMNPGVIDLSPWTTIVSGEQDANDPQLWRISMQTDLRKQELTKNGQTAEIHLQAYNSRGGRSQTFSIVKAVVTQVESPVINIFSVIKFHNKVVNQFEFDIYDPKKEGRVMVTDIAGACGAALPGISNCFCDQNANHARCTIEWAPNAEGPFALNIEAFSQVNVFGQWVTSPPSTEVLKIEVGPAPLPDPNPLPGPVDPAPVPSPQPPPVEN